MPPKSSSKSPKGTVRPKPPVTSLRGSGSSTTNIFGALNDESAAGDEEQDGNEDDEQQVKFGSLDDVDANALLDQAESLHEQQMGDRSSGHSYFSPSVRQDFLEMYSGLHTHGYNQDDKIAVAELLRIGVSSQSLKETLPVLGKTPSGGGLSQKLQPGESPSHQAKVQAIRNASLPEVAEVKSIFNGCVTGDQQSATQAFLPLLNAQFRKIVAAIPGHAGLHSQNFPNIELMLSSFTATGVLTLMTAVNSTASLPFAFKDSGPAAAKDSLNNAQGAAQEKDFTGIEKLLMNSESHGVSGTASKAQLAGITVNRRRSIFFTESNDIGISPMDLDLLSSSFCTLIQDRFTLPVKYIEGMLLLNELVLLLMRFLKVVFQAYPSIFVGLEHRFDQARLVASQVSRHPRSYVNIFELLMQQNYDVSHVRLLPYIAEKLISRLDAPNAFLIGSFNHVRDIYSIILNGNTPVFSQIVEFIKKVTVATADTPIPKGCPPETPCHPALSPPCVFQLFVTLLWTYRSSFQLDASTKLAMEDIFRLIASGDISSLDALRAAIEDHSQKGLFPIVYTKKPQASSVALVTQNSQGKPSAPRGAPPGTCVQYWSKGNCRFGDGCRYTHVSKDSSMDKSEKSTSADLPATSKPVKPSVKSSSFPPALSREQSNLMDEYQSKMLTIQGYLRGALAIPSFVHEYPSVKIGKCLKHVRVPGKDASGAWWDTYTFEKNCECPCDNLPEFEEIRQLLKDARRLHHSLIPSLLLATDIPFPSRPQTISPPSLRSRDSNYGYASKSVRGSGHGSGYGNGSGHGYGQGSNYGWKSPHSSHAGRGHGGNSFLSAAHEWQAWNPFQHPPPQQPSPYGPPQQPLPYVPEVPGDAMASHQAMHMFLGQPPISRPLGSSGGSVSSVQHRGSAASSQAQPVESSSQSFWASGPKPPDGGKGNGKGRDFWN